ncbi:MAG: signal peptidase I [Planctomycetes bacterium]|nr:signal peptidase I [Planctomycetota bacterium]
MAHKKAEHKDRVKTALDGFFQTFHWMVTATAGVMVFLVFEMQAYTIPTGSMADTLRGAHFRLRCSQCGYRYDHNFIPERYKMPQNRTPNFDIPILPTDPRCPSCGYYLSTFDTMPNGNIYAPPALRQPVIKGDRIFVAKCIYQFTDPRRWDVVVFKNPLEPRINFIKRMIGCPGETVELIDGDVFIDGQITRKPARVQKELWMCVYDNDYQPVRPELSRFNGHSWRQPFENVTGGNWDMADDGSSVFTLDSPDGALHTIMYNTAIGNDFKATYAYDNPAMYPVMPICSDLMLRFSVQEAASGSLVGAGLTKYGIAYRARVELGGQMVIEKVGQDGLPEELASKEMDVSALKLPIQFSFANVDHMLVLQAGTERLSYDLGSGYDDAGQRRAGIMPQATIFGAGVLRLAHIGLFRDIHYISRAAGGFRALQAGEGEAFKLGPDEFFVLGDNSPSSKDGRLWEAPGLGNNSKEYRQGTVPRDYLVGKAFVVYWPGAQKPFEKFKVIPYVGGMKLISGSQTWGPIFGQ